MKQLKSVLTKCSVGELYYRVAPYVEHRCAYCEGLRTVDENGKKIKTEATA